MRCEYPNPDGPCPPACGGDRRTPTSAKQSSNDAGKGIGWPQPVGFRRDGVMLTHKGRTPLQSLRMPSGMKQSRNGGDNRSDSPPRPPAASTPPSRGIELPRWLRLLARTVIEVDVNTQTRMVFARLPAAWTGERQRARSNPAAIVAKILDGTARWASL